MSRLKIAVLSMLVSLFLMGSAQATEKFAFGIQNGLASWGISGSYFVNDKLRGQVNVSNFSLGGRGLFILQEKNKVDIYGVGEVGLWYGSYDGVNMAAGAGVEVNWADFIEDIFPLYWNLELGVGFSSGSAGYWGGPIRIGSGVHYRF